MSKIDRVSVICSVSALLNFNPFTVKGLKFTRAETEQITDFYHSFAHIVYQHSLLSLCKLATVVLCNFIRKIDVLWSSVNLDMTLLQSNIRCFGFYLQTCSIITEQEQAFLL